jgi:hypothetical protein
MRRCFTPVQVGNGLFVQRLCTPPHPSDPGLETDEGRSTQFSGGRNARGREFQTGRYLGLNRISIATSPIARSATVDGSGTIINSAMPMCSPEKKSSVAKTADGVLRDTVCSPAAKMPLKSPPGTTTEDEKESVGPVTGTGIGTCGNGGGRTVSIFTVRTSHALMTNTGAPFSGSICRRWTTYSISSVSQSISGKLGSAALHPKHPSGSDENDAA